MTELLTMRVRLDNPRSNLTWRGTLLTFARFNALRPAELLELHDQLDRGGVVDFVTQGELHGTLQRDPTPTVASEVRRSRGCAGRFTRGSGM